MTRLGEQYKGWTAIEGPRQTKMTRAEAAEFLAGAANNGPVKVDDQASLQAAYRAAVMRLHPDRGGDPEEFKKLQQAMEALA